MLCPKCKREYSGDSCPFCEGETPAETSEISENKPLKTETENDLPENSFDDENAETSGENSASEESHDGGKTSEGRKKLTIIIIAAAVVILAIAVAVGVTVSKKHKTDSAEETGDISENQEKDTSPVTFNEDVTFALDGANSDYEKDILEYTTASDEMEAIKETITALASSGLSQDKTAGNDNADGNHPNLTESHIEKTTVVTDTPAKRSPKAEKVIEAFFKGTYYFDGYMISGNEKSPLEMAMDGSDYQVFTELEGKDVSMMCLDSKLYLLDPAEKKYTEINAALKKIMGVSDDDFKFQFNEIEFDPGKPYSVTEARYNGQKGVCYTYKDDKSEVKFVIINDEIKEVVTSGGSADTALAADEFSADIPSDMLTFKGYSKTNMISFMSAFM